MKTAGGIAAFFAIAVACAAAPLFETYYNDENARQNSADRANQPESARPGGSSGTSGGSPVMPPFNRAQPSAQTPSPQTPPAQTPAARNDPARTPFSVRRSVLPAAPHGSFGLGGNFLLRAAAGYGSLKRDISVETKATGEDVFYKGDRHFMGKADGGNLTYQDSESRVKWQLGAGYQLEDDGNFWFLEFARSGDIKEIGASLAITAKSMQIANTIPFLKIGASFGFGDSEGKSPSSFGFLAGLGGYNYLNDARSLRLEYGVDFSRSKWLPIEHNYGGEKWTDSVWNFYFGAAYKF